MSEEADPADTALDLEMRRAILEKHDLREGAVYEPSMDDTCRVLEGVVHSIANVRANQVAPPSPCGTSRGMRFHRFSG